MVSKCFVYALAMCPHICLLASEPVIRLDGIVESDSGGSETTVSSDLERAVEPSIVSVVIVPRSQNMGITIWY